MPKSSTCAWLNMRSSKRWRAAAAAVDTTLRLMSSLRTFGA
ncbi:hypothetical protein [Lysobacter gummosus]